MRYSRTHEWVETEEEDIVAVGFSNRAQEEFGEVDFVEFPEEGEEFEQDDPMGNIQCKSGAVIYIHAPITGEVVEINTALESSPELINISPEGDGWIVKMRVEVPGELNVLMTPDEYEDYEEEVLEEEFGFDDEDEEEY